MLVSENLISYFCPVEVDMICWVWSDIFVLVKIVSVGKYFGREQFISGFLGPQPGTESKS